ncbi:hypothetical protein J2752_002213 [Halarchaeum rubridurum]|uniref:Uncharacterized protein n=1 Tax=Halarchaeum rubridurum TaxID=489911 RepID=A0A830G1H7_9EURY|nr:DUF5787 family protein [Halarchaeum rubridurum]MBP1955290.1 hypothetical protein [Halarchaeum rubridurum]GGM71063.1 hypothetical protein GCM10009017_21460 [Halarchaeum rubridurum]
MAGAEFGFELRVCAWAERHWEPADPDSRVLVARQLGTRRRRWDTVIVEADPAGLSARAAFGADELDADLLDVVRHAPADWTYYRDALPDPGYPWRYVREAIHRASARGVLDERKRANRIEIRRVAPYPDWVRRVVAVENKPDLDASAARALAAQLERDVALGLADEVWVATRADATRALVTEMPNAAGVLTVGAGDDAADDATDEGRDPEAGERDALAVDVAWHPRTLDPDATGVRVTDRGDPTAFEYVDPAEKRETRARLAERAYGRGWRAYADTMRPDCRAFDLRAAEEGDVPYCHAKGREQTAAECSGSCPDFSPEPPGWRQRGWPIEGGPGKTVKRLLDRRRRRRRPGLDERDGDA